nr:unnamed protein product [Callosobruchus analis]
MYRLQAMPVIVSKKVNTSSDNVTRSRFFANISLSFILVADMKLNAEAESTTNGQKNRVKLTDEDLLENDPFLDTLKHLIVLDLESIRLELKKEVLRKINEEIHKLQRILDYETYGAYSFHQLIADIISSSITGPNTVLNDCSMSQRKLCSPLSFLIFNTLQSVLIPVSVVSHTPRHACLLKDLMQVFRALNLLHTSRHSHNSSNTSISI